ncbi:MAG: Hin recombinase [Methylobacterium mesophilicum]|nr:Hin recombinase [Methylobacterium mesophilicum]
MAAWRRASSGGCSRSSSPDKRTEQDQLVLIGYLQQGLRAKEQGRVLGRPSRLNSEQKRAVCEKLGEGSSISALAREFGVSRLTIQRAKDQQSSR